MPRRPVIAPVWALLCLMLLVAVIVTVPGAGPAAAQAPPGPAYPAKAWIVVDAASGRILDAYNEHEALPPASTTKLMTALVATEKLAPGALVTVGPDAAAQPAMRIGMVAGQQWTLDAAMHSLMIVSANDAAYALAEAASGSLAAFADDMTAAAVRYGMVDSRFADPAGLDDAASFGGGNRVSAYDLAVAARNVLAVPELMAMAGTAKYTFEGPDGHSHVLYNHDKLLNRYPGATGLKTGYTALAGHTFVGTATRDGRRMIAVVLNADDFYGVASKLLDKGFATPVDAAGLGEPLPPVRVQPYRAPLASTLLPGKAGAGKTVKSALSTAGATPVAEQRPVRRGRAGWILTFVFFVGSAAGAVVALRRRADRRRRNRAAHRRRLAEIRRAAYLDALSDDDWDVEMAVPVTAEIDDVAPLQTTE